MSDFPSPGRGVICTFIGDFTLKIALLFLTLLSASKPHYKKFPIVVNRIKCKQAIHSIVGCSAVKIKRVSDQYLFYYNFREIEHRS